MARISKRLKSRQQDNLDRWLVSYADYMTLMFALFVVLYALSIVKEKSFDTLSQSLGQIFHITGDKGKGTAGDGILTNQIAQQDVFDGNSLNEEKGPELTDQELLINESKNKKLGNPLQALKQDLQTALVDVADTGDAKLKLNDDWLTIELSSGVLFASGSATANPQALPIIQEVANSLSEVNNYVEVRGYTDDLSINNEIYSSNWELSAARAASITNLLEQFGIVQDRLSIKANGPNDPIASNENAEGRSRNRRVVIALSKYSYLQPRPEEPNKQQLQQKIADKFPNETNNGNELRVIQLPGGGIRITTRQEAENEQKSNNDGNE
ncbi:OmpA family protein [Psychrosphaera aestuarii]|uniref:OmpA family protein n=1 Tax=Psychrosphaera aestuarii TaxID=1266052 RepID=UPI001B3284E4|nr:OmpA family protein [Psychrosphaera aestuarii]